MAVLQSASRLALVLVRRTGPLGGVVFFHTVIVVSTHKQIGLTQWQGSSHHIDGVLREVSLIEGEED